MNSKPMTGHCEMCGADAPDTLCPGCRDSRAHWRDPRRHYFVSPEDKATSPAFAEWLEERRARSRESRCDCPVVDGLKHHRFRCAEPR